MSDGNDDISEQFKTKIELFSGEKGHPDSLVTPESLQNLENQRTYTSLLQNQVLNLQNEDLLNEIHNSDENQFYPDLYSQMQRKNDSASNQVSSEIYSGAFAYTSPPERPLLSENFDE